jgi:hypothetical protein
MTTVVQHDWQETGYVCQYRFTIPHCSDRKVRHLLGGDVLQLQLAGVRMKPAGEATAGLGLSGPAQNNIDLIISPESGVGNDR